MKPLLVILTGHAPEMIRARLGDFDAWFRAALGLPAARVRVVDATAGSALPRPGEVSGAVISGSAAMVTDHEPWSEELAGWIRASMDAELPMFGVCYGHQLMAYALGGRVGELPGGREIGTKTITRLAPAAVDPRLNGVSASFEAHTTHVQSVLEAPAGARVLARSAQDANQIISYSAHAMSTQLHPEFSAASMRGFLTLRAERLRAESLDVERLLKEVRETPEARSLLRQFAEDACPSDSGAKAAHG